MEDLNKNQLILLALLVSFVTSIATGIVTVSLMERAPQSVTQTINRVVTQTIEKVVPAAQPAAVIVPEEDLITAAVEKNSHGMVKIRLGQGGDIVGYGMVVSAGGLVATDVNTENYASDVQYYAVFSDAKEFPLIHALADQSGLTLFRPNFAGPDGKPAYTPEALILGNSDTLKLGQTVLIVAPSGDALQKGIISGLVREATAETSATSTPAAKTVKLIKLSIALSAENSGSPLVNLDGEAVGLTLYRSGIRVAIPSNLIAERVANLPSGN